jgi:hypothetical protein
MDKILFFRRSLQLAVDMADMALIEMAALVALAVAAA